MKKKLFTGLAIGLFMVGIVGLAEAALISEPTQLSDSSVDINFDTTFPTSIDGVTISGFTGYFDTSGFSAPITYPTYVSGNTCRVDPGTLTIIFNSPVSEIGFGLFDPNYSGTGFEAFNINGDSLTAGFVQSPLGSSGGSFASYMGIRESSNIISSVVLTAAVGDLVGLDNISFSSIPIPGAIWLLGSGFAGLIVARRKKHH